MANQINVEKLTKLVNETEMFPGSNYSGFYSDNSTAYAIQELDIWSYVSYMSSIFLMVVSLFLNTVVLQGLNTTDLKSGFLIRGIIVADILVALALGTQILPYTLIAFGCDPVLSLVCYQVYSHPVKSFLVNIQLYTGVIVAVDRLVSLLNPLAYHTSDYSKVQKMAILGGLWLGMLALYVGFNTIDLFQTDTEDPRHICFTMSEAPTKNLFDAFIGPNLAFAGVFVTLFLYIGLLGIIIQQRVHRRRLTGDRNKVQQSNASLAMTFFLVHLAYLLCYLPIIIQYIFFREDFEEGKLPGYDIAAYAITSVIYQFNALIDPMIFTWRIRSVRKYVWSLLAKAPRSP